MGFPRPERFLLLFLLSLPDHLFSYPAMDAVTIRTFPSNATDSNSNAFGPAAASAFDFTSLFEDAMLGILPSALLLSTLPCRILALQRQPPKVAKGGVLSDVKRAFLVVFAAMQLTLLIMLALIWALRIRATVAAAALVSTAAWGSVCCRTWSIPGRYGPRLQGTGIAGRGGGEARHPARAVPRPVARRDQRPV